MKTFFLSVIFLILTLSLTAQPFIDFGIKGGITSSKLEAPSQWKISDHTLNYHAGAFARLGWGRIFLQPEGVFNSRGGKVNEVFDKNPVTTIQNFDFTSIDVPILAGVKVIRSRFFNLRVMGGPVFGFITSGEVPPSAKQLGGYFKDNFFGWQYGAGIDLWFLTLDARIENSRNSVYQSSDYSARNQIYMLSAGIKIF